MNPQRWICRFPEWDAPGVSFLPKILRHLKALFKQAEKC